MDSSGQDDVPAKSQERNTTRWSTESITVIGIGVALLVAMLSGFLSISSQLSNLVQHRENRLETVRQLSDERFEAYRRTLDETVLDLRTTLDERIRKIEIDQAANAPR
jgi:hypothetical protein